MHVSYRAGPGRQASTLAELEVAMGRDDAWIVDRLRCAWANQCAEIPGRQEINDDLSGIWIDRSPARRLLALATASHAAASHSHHTPAAYWQQSIGLAIGGIRPSERT